MPDDSALRRRLRQAATVVRRIVGAPDYERYLAHVQDCHPDRVPMSRVEFWRERLESRYSKPGARCC
jgi:uncharacterized short protein YbdD (DUF466 family)